MPVPIDKPFDDDGNSNQYDKFPIGTIYRWPNDLGQIEGDWVKVSDSNWKDNMNPSIKPSPNIAIKAVRLIRLFNGEIVSQEEFLVFGILEMFGIK